LYEKRQEQSMDDANNGALRILVVDDVADVLETISMLLQLEGHTVATAKNAPGAILRAASFQPDVVLLDIGLPEISGNCHSPR
jgi:CheY-like chemotaxis protein